MKSGNILFIFRLGCFLVILPFNKISAQIEASQTSFYQQSLSATRALYHQSFGDQSAVYNGIEYPGYLFGFESGQPFFYRAEPSAGSVIYGGTEYDSIIMRYDEIKDVLVVNNHQAWIQLYNDKVNGFKLFGSEFILLIKDSLSSNLFNSGFYNLLYKGKVSVFKKQVKTLSEKLTLNAELLRFVDVHDHYYVKKEDKFYPIKSKKDLFEIFGDNKKDMQKFVKINRLNFRKDPQNTITKTAAYYDSLKK